MSSNEPAPLDAVVFDMDGVIFDTEPIWLLAETELMARRGHVFPPSLAKRLMGVPGTASMAIVAGHFGLDEDPIVMAAELNGLFHDLLESKITLMPGLLDRLDDLERLGIAKGVATSTERTLAHHMLGRFGLIERFAFILTRDDVARGKPNPEIYEKACQRLGSRPGRTLVIEDSLAGCQAGKEAGCHVCALRHPLTADLDFPHADLVVDQHADERLTELLGRGIGSWRS